MATYPGVSRAQGGTAGAATASEPTARAADAFCWRGRPLPRCAAFALFELDGQFAVASTRTRYRTAADAQGGSSLPTFERHLGWTLGAMRNVSARTAVGATLTGAAAGQGHFVAASARLRRWTGANTSVELAAGPALPEVPVPAPFPGMPDAQGEARRPGVLLDARLNGADLVALTARAVVVPRAGGRTHAAGFVGASLGSHAAVAGNVVLGALTALVIYAISGAGT
jgi:hypothetical protein